MPTNSETYRVATLFIGDNVNTFLTSPAFLALRRDVADFGILFIDTEFTDANTLKSMGCSQRAGPGTMDLFVLGGMSGAVALLQVQYDCRQAHKCHCLDACGSKSCPSVVSSHAPWEHGDLFHNYGVSVPEIVVDWLKDTSVLKVQSQVIRTDGCLGDIDPVSYTHLTLPTTPYV